MPSYVVRARPGGTKDGSLGPGRAGSVIVRTTDEQSARLEGAQMLDVSPLQVIVERYADPMLNAAREEWK